VDNQVVVGSDQLAKITTPLLKERVAGNQSHLDPEHCRSGTARLAGADLLLEWDRNVHVEASTRP
jgi:hypothetical protein